MQSTLTRSPDAPRVLAKFAHDHFAEPWRISVIHRLGSFDNSLALRLHTILDQLDIIDFGDLCISVDASSVLA